MILVGLMARVGRVWGGENGGGGGMEWYGGADRSLVDLRSAVSVCRFSHGF